MKNIKTLYLIIVCLLLSLSTGVFGSTSAENIAVGNPSQSNISEVQTVGNKTLAYVPLDNRPINVDRVNYLATSLGYTIIMPPEDAFATKLDGQPLNKNKTQYGDCQKLLAWIQQKDSEGCDNFVISLDQVLSGGLVNSRVAMFEEEVSEPNPSSSFGTEDDDQSPGDITNSDNPVEFDYIDTILTALTNDVNNKVCFVDTVMRLASTVGYNGYGLQEYDALREYGKVSRAELTGDDLTIEKIVAGYSVNKTGKPCENVLANDSNGAKKAILTANDGEIITNYLKARERKLRIIDRTLDKIKGDNIYFLIGVDDSSPGVTVQKNEIEYITNKLGDRGAVFDGADELGMMAISYLQSRDRNTGLPVSLTYFGDTPEATGDYESEKLNKVITKHISALNAKVATSTESAKISVLVLTPPKITSLRYYYSGQLVNTYLENIKNHVPTIILDASSGTYYGALQERLVKETDLGYLLGYSSWNTLGNTAGIALSEGISRYHYLSEPGEKTDVCHKAFIKLLTFGFVKDIAYHKDAKETIDSYIMGLKYNTSNFYSKSLNIAKINGELNTQLTASSLPFIKNLQKSNIITDLSKYEEKGLSKISLSNFHFPWYRTFECTFDMNVDNLTDPHHDSQEPIVKTIEHKPYINGYQDGTFHPGNSVSRAEVCKMIVSAKEIPTMNFRGIYSDVTVDNWSWPYVEVATYKGYMRGHGNGLFGSISPMTRGEFASFLVKFADIEGIPISGTTKIFSDVLSTDWFYEDVSRASALGFIKGYGDGSFQPNQPVTRGESVAMINRLLGRNLEAEGVSEALILSKNPFSDISTSYWGYKDVLESSVFHSFTQAIKQ